jgi:hypothetical protein
MQAEVSRWSGDGDFTRGLVARLETFDEIVLLSVEDAPASRSEAGYAFLSTEIYVGFASREHLRPARWLGIVPVRRRVRVPALTLGQLEARLAEDDGIGPADYQDEGMLQYLRTVRIRQPYQSRGVKLIELVRLYPVGLDPRGATARTRP